MILAETIFLEGVPVGMLRQDSNSGQINFSPIKGKSPLSDQSWSSVDELKAAITAAYFDPINDEGRSVKPRPSTNHPWTRTFSTEPTTRGATDATHYTPHTRTTPKADSGLV